MAQLDFVPDPPDIIVIYKQGAHLKVDIDQMLVNTILGREIPQKYSQVSIHKSVILLYRKQSRCIHNRNRDTH